MTGPSNHMWATFRLADEMFALPVDNVQEVLTRQPLAAIPLAPAHVAGLLNLRGQLIPAVDARALLGLAPRSVAANWFVLVIRHEGQVSSVVVDEIGDVLELNETSWRPTPLTVSPDRAPLIRAVRPLERGTLVALCVERLMDEERAAS
jgi:purine-binding chemotaxis protein CheW